MSDQNDEDEPAHDATIDHSLAKRQRVEYDHCNEEEKEEVVYLPELPSEDQQFQERLERLK